MAMLPKVFKASEHESMRDFTPIPGDKYLAQIIKSEIKDTKAGDGKRLLMQEKILEGEYKGRIVFIGLNILNPSEIAEKIANEELKSIAEAVGKGNTVITDSQVLHGIPHYIHVVVVPATDAYPAKNEIKKYESAGVSGGSDNSDPFEDDGAEESEGTAD
jgi:hypothetical protein